jgi:hypothetical protein
MTRNVVALYDNFEDANAAVRDLVDQGFQREEISFMAADKSRMQRSTLTDVDEGVDSTVVADDASGAGVGAGVGAAVGGLAGVLIGLGALAIPGIGPIIAAGPLATVLAGLAGAGAGAVAGGILGALVDMGVPEETAGYYAEGVRRGGTLVSVRVDDQYTDKALNILNRHNPVDLNERTTQWRSEGWTGYRDDVADTTPYGGSGTGTTEDRYVDPTRYEDVHDTEYDDTTGMVRDQTRFDNSGMTNEGYDRGRQEMDRDYRQYDEDFRSDFQKRPFSRDFTYEQYEPAYRYGYDLTMDERYRNRTWEEVEPDVRSRWEEQQPGTWDQYRDAVHYSWQNAGDYWRYDDRFKTHFQRAGYGTDYEMYRPGYRFGYDLARSERYRGRDWDEIEMDARREWEQGDDRGPWDRFRDAIRHAWEETKQAVR